MDITHCNIRYRGPLPIIVILLSYPTGDLPAATAELDLHTLPNQTTELFSLFHVIGIQISAYEHAPRLPCYPPVHNFASRPAQEIEVA